MSNPVPSKKSRQDSKREYLNLVVDRLRQFTGLDPSYSGFVSNAYFTSPGKSRVQVSASFKNRLLYVDFVVILTRGAAVRPFAGSVGTCAYITTNPSVHGGNKREFYAALKEVCTLLL